MAHKVELAAVIFGDLAALFRAPGTVLYDRKTRILPQQEQLIQGGIKV